MKKLITGGALAGTLLLPACKETPKQPARPNIVYIMCDDHSFQTIGAYGHALSRIAPTPNIDRLAREGMLFTNAFVENSLSTPSRACLMTGLYSHQNGQRTLGKGIDSTRTFFTELLQKEGYRTGVVGKWHLQCEPKGFDYFCILNDQGEYYNPVFRTRETQGKYVREEGYVTTLTTDHAIEFLEKTGDDEPFCLLVHHKAPHRNWMPEEKYLELFADTKFPEPDNFRDDYSTRCEPARSQEMSIGKNMTLVYDLKLNDLKDREPYCREWSSQGMQDQLERMTDAQRDAWEKAYDLRYRDFVETSPEGENLVRWKYQHYIRDYLRCIRSVDDQVGRLLDYLGKRGLRENTIVVYTSDQGFYMGEHGWFDKRFMYEESMRTPLIVCWPETIQAGTVCEALVQNIDFAPTILDAAGIEKPSQMVGATLRPFFEGETPENWRKYLYYHYYDYPAIHQVRRHDGVRDERYKLIHFYGEGFGKDKGHDLNCNELYDLRNDPQEMRNLYGDPDYGDIRNRLQEELDRFRQQQQVDEY